MLPLSLDPACSWHFWILTALLVDSSEATDLAHTSLLTSFFWCHHCLLKLMSFQPLSVDVSFSWYPYLWASLFLETFFCWHSLLSTSHSLDRVFAWHHFLVSCCFTLLFWDQIVSFDTLCLDISFVLSPFFILTSLSFDIFVPCEHNLSCGLQDLHKALPVPQSLPKVFPSTTSYYKACTKYFPARLRTTKLAQSTPQYYFVLQSLHKVLPSTTSYYKACTKYFPVLLHTTKLSQSTSQYYFLLQSLHKVLPSTASYCKACTKYFPVYNTSYCKACTKYFPVLLRTTKLLHTEALTQQSFYTQKLLHTEALHTEKLLRSKALTHRRFWHTHKLLDRVALSHRSFHTEKLLDTKAFAHASFYTE